MIVGPTIVAIFSFGVHPSGMKNAVTRPQAMIAAMLGMIMFDKKVPNFCTWTRTDVRDACVSGAVDMPTPLSVRPEARCPGPVTGVRRDSCWDV